MWRDCEKGKLQNSVWRLIVGALSFAPVVTLQGEVGSSSVGAGNVKIKLKFAMYLMMSKNDLLKEVFRFMREGRRKGRWLTQLEKYMDIGHIRTELGRTDGT